jgi:tetratricopeptide (TPR) repeat protein
MELLRNLDEQDKLATTLNAFGLALDLNGEAEAAREAWREALSMQKVVGNAAGVASTLNNIGSAMERRGDVEGAIKHYADALAIQERIGELSEQIIVLGNLRVAYFKVGRRAESIQALHRVLGIQEKVGDRFGAAATLHKLAETFASDGITPGADEHYARAMAAFEALGEPAEVAFVEMDRALVVACR